LDIFVAKLSSSGSWSWVVKAGGSSGDFGNGIALDSSGNAYVTGYFFDRATFGSTSLTSSGSSDIFVAKLSSSGSWAWAIKAGGSSSDIGSGIAADSNANAYVTGSFSGTATFGGNSLVSLGGDDIFVVRIAAESDGDHIADVEDDFPFEVSQVSDQDGDEFGDNLTGYHGDSCPSVYGSSWQDRWGCPDMDSDGQSDLFDAYMQQPTQWNDTDGDGLGDNWDGVNVNRNGSTNGIGEYWLHAYLPDPSPLDYDNDGFEDLNLQAKGASGPYDDCPLIYGLSTNDSSGCIDSDGDGWSDAGDSHPGDGTQHSDSDGDGYGDNPNGNLPDFCPQTNGSSTKDVYGCPDGDGDGVSYLNDFDDTDNGEWSDMDNDNYGDNSDQCPFIHGNISSGAYKGCPDSDGDSWADEVDALPHEPTQYEDKDGDGFGDDPMGATPDACVNSSGSSTKGVEERTRNVTKYGCQDTDRDQYDDGTDPCPFQFGNSWVDRLACPDADQDGISDAADPYPDIPAPNENDWDGDGVPEADNQDKFPADATQWADADSDGHGDNLSGTEPDLFPNDATQWSDADGDGYGDNQSDGANRSDSCPSVTGTSTDTATGLGCTDSDGDGVGDRWDDFNDDETQWSDSDKDGYGDNQNGTDPDACVYEYGTSYLGQLGCPDSDRDGWGDDEDAFDSDPTQTKDSDSDGYGDSPVGHQPDSCPQVSGSSSEEDIYGCPDADGDGFADTIDPYPTDSQAWSDVDGDGFPDQLEANNSDDCPGVPGGSHDFMQGCPDFDGDGLPDIFDDDIDGDGITNSLEAQAGFNAWDASSVPGDNDGDRIPDLIDPDDDNDGFPDGIEYERGSDPYDANETPFNMYGGGNSGFYYSPNSGFNSSYVEGGIEVSLSMLMGLAQSELILPLLLAPPTIMFARRKKMRFRRMERKLERAANLQEVTECEEEIDDMMTNNKIKIEKGIVLSNIAERKRQILAVDGERPSGWEDEFGGVAGQNERSIPPEGAGGDAGRYADPED
jgi:hypothetical protein